ncbi:MAG TPA: hypothetical protein VE714_03155 [Gemmatimonadales bacterium]|nr:hypothetical protein [Gemmatimonadales bacterium]
MHLLRGKDTWRCIDCPPHSMVTDSLDRVLAQQRRKVFRGSSRRR